VNPLQSAWFRGNTGFVAAVLKNAAIQQQLTAGHGVFRKAN
jgi:hypothetical protein